MHKVIFNPFTHNLQLIKKEQNIKIVKVSTITQCRNNKEYIVDSPQLQEFILPLFSSDHDFIRIYGRNDFGWKLYIPENKEVMFPDEAIMFKSHEYIQSNNHQYDFIYLIYIKGCWFIDNYSKNISIGNK